MAATYRSSAAGGATSGTSDRTVVITPAVGDLIIVAVCLSGNTNDVPTMTDNNGFGTYDRILCVPWSASANRLAVFVRTALMVNTTSTTITCASGSNTAGELVAVAVAGMTRAGTSAIRSSGSQSNQATSTTPAPALSQTSLTGNLTICGVGSGDTTTTFPTNWSERQDVSQATPTTALEIATRDSGFVGTTITFGATQSTVYASFALELDGSAAPISGTLEQTVPAVTSSATATLEVQGSASSAIPAVTATATGTVALQGAADASIGSVGIDATATIETAGVDGTLTQTIAPVSASATGAAELQATASPTIAPVTSSATGAVALEGAASLAIGEVTPVAIGEVSLQGTASPTLGAVIASATGAVALQGVAAPVVGAVTSAADGDLVLQGSATAAIGAVTLSAQGTTADIPIVGELSQAIAPVTNDATGAVAIQAAMAATIAPVQSNAAGAVQVTAAVTSTVEPVTASATSIIVNQDAEPTAGVVFVRVFANQIVTVRLLVSTVSVRRTALGGFMAGYIVGQVVRFEAEFRNADNVLTDPTEVLFSWVHPSGISTSLTYEIDASLVRYGRGLYRVDLEVDAPGRWQWSFSSTGSGQAVRDGAFTARAARV